MYEALSPKGLAIVAIALDSRGEAASRPWIERAAPSYPCLIDQRHVLSELYGITNVPTAFWVDEEGRIVRPPESSSGASYGSVFSHGRFDRAKGTLTEDGEAALRQALQPYRDAVADWVMHGSASRFGLSPETILERTTPPDGKRPEAAACFHLARYLFDQGQAQEAAPLFQRATELWPESISYLRQWGDIEVPGSMGGERFFKRTAEARARGEALSGMATDIYGE